jgi:hypothetical protein
LKDPDKIAEDISRKRGKAVADHAAAVAKAEAAIDEEYRRTALDASTGHAVCACVALGDDDVASAEVHDPANFTLQHEREMLEDLFRGIGEMLEERARDDAADSLNEQDRRPADETALALEIQRHRVVPVIVAHHAGFDVRFLWQRAIALGVTPPAWWPIDARPWDQDRIADTMTMWAGVGNRIGLDRLCRALSLPGKSDVDGSMVWYFVQAGRIDEVVSYCGDDVRRLRSVHRRLLGLQALRADIDALDIIMTLPGDMEMDDAA